MISMRIDVIVLIDSVQRVHATACIAHARLQRQCTQLDATVFRWC